MAMFGGRLVIFAGGKAGWGQSGDEGKKPVFLELFSEIHRHLFLENKFLDIKPCLHLRLF